MTTHQIDPAEALAIARQRRSLMQKKRALMKALLDSADPNNADMLSDAQIDRILPLLALLVNPKNACRNLPPYFD